MPYCLVRGPPRMLLRISICYNFFDYFTTEILIVYFLSDRLVWNLWQNLHFKYPQNKAEVRFHVSFLQKHFTVHQPVQNYTYTWLFNLFLKSSSNLYALQEAITSQSSIRVSFHWLSPKQWWTVIKQKFLYVQIRSVNVIN